VSGRRGPLTGSTYGKTAAGKALRTVRPAPRAVEAPPAHLGVVGSAIWRDLWQSMPILSPKIDGHSVTRYCEAADDASRARAEIEARGLLIDEVLADPRGGILATKVVLNPAEQALRRADKVMTELSDRLALSPAARARLGLVVNTAELAGAEAGRILGTMFTPAVIDVEEAE
jgi:P27 family predicted phage terminase small subunit